MTQTIASLFAELTAKLEDTIGIAVEGQRRDNAADMNLALLCHARMGVAAMDVTLSKIAQRLGDAHG